MIFKLERKIKLANSEQSQLEKTIEQLQILNRLGRIEEGAMASVKKINFDELWSPWQTIILAFLVHLIPREREISVQRWNIYVVLPK